MKKRTVLVCALAMAVGGCSSTVDDAENSGSVVGSEIVADGTSQELSSSTVMVDGADSGDATATASSSQRWIESLVEEQPTSNGWRLDPGEWTTSAFRTPVSLVVPEGLVLVDRADSMITLASAGDPASRNRIVIARSSAITTRDGRQLPVPETPGDVTALLESESTTTILDQGLLPEGSGGEIGWWDIVLEDLDGEFRCPIADRCGAIAVTSGGDRVETPTGVPFRLYSVNSDEVRFGVYVVGSDPGLEQLTVVAEQLALTARPEIEAAQPEFEVNFLSSIGSRARQIEAGHYRRTLGAGLVDLGLEKRMPGVGITVSDGWILGFEGRSGFVGMLALADGTLVRPDIDQTGFTDPARVVDPGNYLQTAPSTVEAFRNWIEEIFDVTNEGTATIRGRDVPWFEFAVVDENAFECPPFYGSPEAEHCMVLHTSWFHSDAESTSRHYLFAEAGVLIAVGTNGNATIEAALDEFRPLFDGLEVTPLPR